jgi:hypothetical protein
LNRAAVEEIEFDHSHISGGISKINTADNVFGIFTSRAMRERGRYQVQLMKTRSSSGVGSKVDLEFNLESLRITDLGEEHQSDNGQPAPSELMKSIKTTTTVGEKPVTEPKGDQPKVSAEVQSSKLKQMLSNIKSQ